MHLIQLPAWMAVFRLHGCHKISLIVEMQPRACWSVKASILVAQRCVAPFGNSSAQVAQVWTIPKDSAVVMNVPV